MLGRLRWLVAAVCVAAAAALLIVVFRPRPPLRLADAAWQIINDAEVGEAAAPKGMLESARERYDKAWASIQTELEKFLPMRDFKSAESLLYQAIALAEESEKVAAELRKDRRKQLELRVAELRQLLHHHDEESRYNLHTVTLRQLTTAAELKIHVAERQLAESDDAEAAVVDAELALYDLRAALEASYSGDEETLELSKKWFEETLKWTKATDSAALIVVKTRHMGYLLKRGKVVSSFPVELGFRSGRQKLLSGDGATPEGVYRIKAKRMTGATYYRALDIDYPNAYDRKRFEKAKKSGLISPSARIGGSIQVHGEGGRGSDWTEGCVAVTNEKMDYLMQQMRVGERVTIVRRLNGWPQ